MLTIANTLSLWPSPLRLLRMADFDLLDPSSVNHLKQFCNLRAKSVEFVNFTTCLLGI
jgi:hypothetical protein